MRGNRSSPGLDGLAAGPHSDLFAGDLQLLVHAVDDLEPAVPERSGSGSSFSVHLRAFDGDAPSLGGEFDWEE